MELNRRVINSRGDFNILMRSSDPECCPYSHQMCRNPCKNRHCLSQCVLTCGSEGNPKCQAITCEEANPKQCKANPNNVGPWESAHPGTGGDPSVWGPGHEHEDHLHEDSGKDDHIHPADSGPGDGTKDFGPPSSDNNSPFNPNKNGPSSNNNGPSSNNNGPSSNNNGPSSNNNGPTSNNYGPSSNNNGPISNNNGPSSNGNGPNSNNNGPSSNNNGPSSNNNGPSSNNYGPSSSNNGPLSNNNGPSSNSNGPSNNNNGPSSNNNGPSSNNNGPSSNSNGPSSNNNGPSSNNNGPSSSSNGPSSNNNGPSSNDNGPSSNSNGPSNNDNGPSGKGNGPNISVKKCDENYTQIGNKCFALMNKPTSWLMGLTACMIADGTIATIHSKKEQAALLELTGGKKSWIGLKDFQDEGHFSWMNQEPVVYTNWAQGEPSGEDEEDCVAMGDDGTWSDEHCKDNLPYICQKDLPK